MHALQSQGGDEGGTDTAAVFGGQNLDGVMAAAERLAVAAFGPVEDFLEGLGAAGLWKIGLLVTMANMKIGVII